MGSRHSSQLKMEQIPTAPGDNGQVVILNQHQLNDSLACDQQQQQKNNNNNDDNNTLLIKTNDSGDMVAVSQSEAAAMHQLTNGNSTDINTMKNNINSLTNGTTNTTDNSNSTEDSVKGTALETQQQQQQQATDTINNNGIINNAVDTKNSNNNHTTTTDLLLTNKSATLKEKQIIINNSEQQQNNKKKTSTLQRQATQIQTLAQRIKRSSSLRATHTKLRSIFPAFSKKKKVSRYLATLSSFSVYICILWRVSQTRLEAPYDIPYVSHMCVYIDSRLTKHRISPHCVNPLLLLLTLCHTHTHTRILAY